MDQKKLFELLKILNTDGVATSKEVADQLEVSVEMLDEFLRYLTTNGYLVKENDPDCEGYLQKLPFKMSDPCGVDLSQYSMLTEKSLNLLKGV
jgi:hypothetical protein